MLFREDCLETLKAIKTRSVHTVFADPPFNLGKNYGSRKDSLSEDEYLNWSYEWLEGCSRIIVDGGALFVYILPKWGYHFANFLDDSLTFRHWIALTMKGTFRRGRRLYPAHYALLYFTKGEPRVVHNIRTPIQRCKVCGEEIKDYGGYRKFIHRDGISLSDFWDDTFPNRHNHSKFREANELNSIIPERAVKISTRQGDVVMDPFGGGGTTYQIAEANNRYWIGCETGDCRPIIKRMKTHFRNSAGRKPPKKLTAMFY